MFASFPRSCITENSGGSRNRPVSNPLAEIKFPQFFPPYATLNPTFVVPNVPYDIVTAPCGVVTPCPDCVVTLITTLVFPPYSAGGAPEITSIDCTASSGS